MQVKRRQEEKEEMNPTVMFIRQDSSQIGRASRLRASGLTATNQYKVLLNKEEEELMLNLVNAVDRCDIIALEKILTKRKQDELARNPQLLPNQEKDTKKDYFMFYDRWIFNFDVSSIQQTSYHGRKGTTLLHIASLKADINMIKLLVETYHVDPRYFVRDMNMTSTRNFALGERQLSAPLQISNGSGLSVSDLNSEVGKNPLESALDMVQKMSTVVDYLNQKCIEKSGKTRKSLRKTLTASQQAANIISTFLQFAAEGDIEEMKEMLDNGAVDVNSCDYDKRTACHLAASEGRLDVLKFLIEDYPAMLEQSNKVVVECDIIAQDRWGHTPFDDAVRANKTDCADYLRELGGGEENTFHMKDSSAEEFMILQARGISEKWAIESKDFVMDKDPFASGAGGQLFKVSYRGLNCVAKSCSGMTTNNTKLAVDLGNEISMMATLRHPHLVMFLGACFQMSPPILLMEFCEGGTLEEKIRKMKTPETYKLPRKTRLRYIQELATAVCFLHSHNPPIVHRDLKPSNVLISGDRIKVTDFGLSKFIPAKNKKLGDKFTMTGETGSYRFMAPEVFKHEEYNAKVDVYSFALIAYWVITGVKPFTNIADPVEAVRRASIEGYRPDTTLIKPYKNTCKLIEQAWSQDSSLRPSFAEITQALQSKPFVNDFKQPFWKYW